MANKHILGQNIQLWVNDKTIAFAKTASFTINVDEIDISTKDEGGYAAFEAGLINWEMSSENLIGDPRSGLGFDELMNLVFLKEPVKVVYGLKDITTGRAEEYLVPEKDGWPKPTKTSRYEGEAILTSLSQTSSNGEVATMSVTLKGRSPLKQIAATAGKDSASGSTDTGATTMSLPKTSSTKA